jgi:hypothetical protein
MLIDYKQGKMDLIVNEKQGGFQERREINSRE